MLLYSEFVSNCDGFKMIGRNWAEPGSPFIAVHDMMDHKATDTGTVEEELRALGASLLTRAMLIDSNIFSRGLWTTIASDVKTTLYNAGIVDCGGCLALQWSGDGSPRRKVEAAPESSAIREEDKSLFMLVEQSLLAFLDERIIKKCVDWLRVGYSEAHARYAKNEAKGISRLFMEVVKTLRIHCDQDGLARVLIDTDSEDFVVEFERT